MVAKSMSEDGSSFFPSMHALEEKVLMDRFHVLHAIGSGGMAWVYKALDLQQGGQIVVLKVLQPQLSQKEPSRRRFLKEGRLQAKLSHKNIVKVFEVHELGELVFIVMEWVQGESLRGLLKRFPPPISLDAVIQLATPMFRSVGYAHSLNMIHRDIKPENFLVDWSQPTPQIKAADFGLAKIIDAETKNETKTGMMMGTIAFMSPEQAADTKRVDHRADIYSLGVCLYILATGYTPFEGSFNQILFKVLSSQPILPHKANPDCSEDLSAIIQKCMAKNAEERYASCEDVLSALHQLSPSAANAKNIEIEGLEPPVIEEQVPRKQQVFPSGSAITAVDDFSGQLSTTIGATPTPFKGSKNIFVGLGVLVLGVALFLVLNVFSSKKATGVRSCKEGEIRACYTGPPGTNGKGICRGGKQTCTKGKFGACEGETLPEKTERCNEKDDDCNGKVDDAPAFAAKGKSCIARHKDACQFPGKNVCSSDGSKLSCKELPDSAKNSDSQLLLRLPPEETPYKLQVKISNKKLAGRSPYKTGAYKASESFCIQRFSSDAMPTVRITHKRYYRCVFRLKSKDWKRKQLILRPTSKRFPIIPSPSHCKRKR